MAQEQNDTIPSTGYLKELRRRITVCFVAFIITFALSYVFRERLFNILMWPIKEAMPPGKNIIFTSLSEAFFCHVKTAFISALLFTIPVIMYEMWLFVAPGLYDKGKRLLLPFVFLSSFFFIGGALFGHFIVFPYVFQYLIGFSNLSPQLMPSMRECFSLASLFLFVFGCAFELPLALTLLAKAPGVTTSFINKYHVHAVVIIFIVSALITPTMDSFSLILIAVPFVALYEVGIIVAMIFGKKVIEENDAQLAPGGKRFHIAVIFIILFTFILNILIGNPNLGMPEIIIVICLFLLIEAIDVYIIAFRSSIKSGLLCLFIPFYSPYFVIRNSKELYRNRRLPIIWAGIVLICVLSILIWLAYEA